MVIRDIFEAVIPGYHMNKDHWNTVILNGTIPPEEIENMIDDINQQQPKIQNNNNNNWQDMVVEDISDNMLISGLKNGINYLNKKFGKLKVLWGDINKLIRGDVKLSLAGGPDILRAIYPIQTKEGYLKSIAGDAYMALVQWDNNGNINSESIHQFGSAILDDKSVHYSDQAYLFSKEKLKPAYLDIKDILKHSKSIRIIY